MIDRLLTEICTHIIMSAQLELEAGYNDPMLSVHNLCRRVIDNDGFWDERLLNALAVRVIMLLWHNAMERNELQNSPLVQKLDKESKGQ